jgi:hypothetical protein
VQTAQAGIFHAVTLSLFVELDKPIDAGSAAQAPGAQRRHPRPQAPGALGPVQAAGEEELLVGDVQAAGDNASGSGRRSTI